jgi:YhgE/Pip-like protein
MQALRVLISPRVWFGIVGVAAVLALIYFAYLAAVASPEENLEDLPIALVNEDEGAKLGGQEVDLGDRVVEKVTDPDSPAADTVEWAKLGGRDEAMEGIGNDEYYGALVIPAGYSERISSLITPPTIPIAVVNEDEGAVMNGQPMRLGEEVEKRITARHTGPAFRAVDPDRRPRHRPRRSRRGRLLRRHSAAGGLLAATGEHVRSSCRGATIRCSDGKAYNTGAG